VSSQAHARVELRRPAGLLCAGFLVSQFQRSYGSPFVSETISPRPQDDGTFADSSVAPPVSRFLGQAGAAVDFFQDCTPPRRSRVSLLRCPVSLDSYRRAIREGPWSVGMATDGVIARRLVRSPATKSAQTTSSTASTLAFSTTQMPCAATPVTRSSDAD